MVLERTTTENKQKLHEKYVLTSTQMQNAENQIKNDLNLQSQAVGTRKENA